MTPERKRAAFKALTVLIPIAVIAAVWHFAGLSSYRSPRDVADALEQLAARPLGWALVPLGFALGAALFVPVNALIAGVTLTFDPVPGIAFAMIGGLLAASVSYGAGRLFGPAVVELFKGPKVDKVIERLRAAPFRTSLVLHLLPVGSFTGVNLIAGALRVPFTGFLLGTMLGLLPGVLFFTFVSAQHALPFIGLAALAVVLLVIALKHFAKERVPS